MNAKEVNRYIGTRIRRARQDRDLSLRDLADRLKTKRGYSTMSLSSMERGETPIEVADLEVLASELQMPVSYFMPNTAVLQNTNLAMDEQAMIEALRRLPPGARAKIVKAVFAFFDTHRETGS